VKNISGIEPHKFPKGKSGNPKGRPKLPDLNEALAKYLSEEKEGKTALEAVLMKLRQMATAGNLKAAEMLLDRAYGKPKQTTDVTTNGKDIVLPPISWSNETTE
jgi:hypothetical protein